MRKVFCHAEIKEILLPLGEALSALSAISAGHYYLMRKVFCPTEIKEIKEILLPARCEVLSALSAISVGHYYLMRIVFYCPDFYCPAEIKEIKEIFIPLGEALSAISALSAGRLLSHADSIFCPTVIGFAASLVEEMKEIKEIFVPTREAFLLFLLFLRDLKHASCLDLFYYPKEMKEIKDILLPSLCAPLSAISAISAGLKTCQLVGFVLLSQRNEGNKGYLVTLTLRSPFCYFCSFCGTISSGGL